MRKILWRSDLWSFSLTFGLVGLLFIAGAVFQDLHRQPGEAFGGALVGSILLAAAIAVAFIDRELAEERAKLFPKRPREVKLARAIVWEHSCLNPKNIPPGKKNPPDIG